MTRAASNEDDTIESEDRHIGADGTPHGGKPGGRIVISDSRRSTK